MKKEGMPDKLVRVHNDGEEQGQVDEWLSSVLGLGTDRPTGKGSPPREASAAAESGGRPTRSR